MQSITCARHGCTTAVIEFLHTPSKWYKTSASMNGRQMRQRDAAPMVPVPASMTDRLHSSKKKQLQVWGHQAAGRHCTSCARHSSWKCAAVRRRSYRSRELAPAGHPQQWWNDASRRGNSKQQMDNVAVASKQSWHWSSTRPRRFVNCCRPVNFSKLGQTWRHRNSSFILWKTCAVGVSESWFRKDIFTPLRF